MGGRGVNILTSLVAGGGGAGATSEARSMGCRAGEKRPGGGEVVLAGEAEGGGGPVGRGMLAEPKRPRLGLGMMGVPSSSKSSDEVRLWVAWVGSGWCGEEGRGVLGRREGVAAGGCLGRKKLREDWA